MHAGLGAGMNLDWQPDFALEFGDPLGGKSLCVFVSRCGWDPCRHRFRVSLGVTDYDRCCSRLSGDDGEEHLFADRRPSAASDLQEEHRVAQSGGLLEEVDSVLYPGLTLLDGFEVVQPMLTPKVEEKKDAGHRQDHAYDLIQF